jgi:hypothetical protein
MSGASSRRAEPLAWLVLGICLVAAVRAHLVFFNPPTTVHHQDEGYITAFAQRMIEGRMLPYVDAVSHRGPLLYWTVALTASLFEPFSWLPIRVLGLGAMVLAVYFAFLAARAAGRPFAGAVAAIAIVLNGLVITGPYDGMSFNGEHLLDVFAMVALYLTTVALGAPRAPRRTWALFGAGLAGACAMLSKQNGAVTLVALGVWLVFAVQKPAAGVTPRERMRMLLAFILGALVPPLALLTRFAVAGELPALWYWAVAYNKDVYMAPFAPGEMARTWHAWITHFATQLMLTVALSVWGLLRPYLRRGLGGYARGFSEDGFVPAVAAGTLLSLVVCNGALRGFAHYYIQVVPWVGLLFGAFLEDAVGFLDARRGRVVRALIAAPATALIFIGWQWSVREHRVANRAMRDWATNVCALVADNVRPDERLFVWGFRPDLYTHCKRRAASKFVFTTFVAGFVPWFAQMSREDEDRLEVPGARDEVLAELERWQVPLVLDDPTSMANRTMTRYPKLAEYLDAHYCFAGVQHSLFVYIRKERAREGCPAIPRAEAVLAPIRLP